jgi:amino acid transporter
MREKILTAIICLIGILAIFYGMINKNNVIFIIGVLFVVAGYLLIRRKLKESIRGKRSKNPP